MNPLPRLREIRDELRHLRPERDRLLHTPGYSLRQLARASGLSPSQIRRIRNR